MLKDVSVNPGFDLTVEQTEAPRAANVLSTQLGILEYAPDFGIDMRYFLQSEFQIQNVSFKAYCVQRLLEHRINVINVIEKVENLFRTNLFLIGSSENNGGLIG